MRRLRPSLETSLSRVAQLEDTVLVDGQLPVAIDVFTLARLAEQQYSREGLSYEVIKKTPVLDVVLGN